MSSRLRKSRCCAVVTQAVLFGFGPALYCGTKGLRSFVARARVGQVVLGLRLLGLPQLLHLVSLVIRQLRSSFSWHYA